VDRVHLSEEMRQPLHEVLPGQAAQVVLRRQIAEDLAGVRLDALRQAEHVRLRDGDGADLAGPRVDPTEDTPVERLQVGQIEPPGQGSGLQIGQRGRGDVVLEFVQEIAVGETQMVPQNPRNRVHIRVDHHRCR
jgi:hypothetical protein